jgi:hypothetical protein
MEYYFNTVFCVKQPCLKKVNDDARYVARKIKKKSNKIIQIYCKDIMFM